MRIRKNPFEEPGQHWLAGLPAFLLSGDVEFRGKRPGIRHKLHLTRHLCKRIVQEDEHGFAELHIERILLAQEAQLLGFERVWGFHLDAAPASEGRTEDDAVHGIGELDDAVGECDPDAVARQREVLDAGGLIG